MSEPSFVHVVPLAPVEGVFTYRVPPGMAAEAAVGARVLMPFGRRSVTGVVVETGAPATEKARDIVDVLDARPALTPELVAWADVIFVMERAHERRLRQRFGRHLRDQRVVCLGIPDDYAFLDARLITILEGRVPRHLGTVGA